MNKNNGLTDFNEHNLDSLNSEILLNENLEIIYVNENAEKLINIHRSILLNKNLEKIVPDFLPLQIFIDLKKNISRKLKISRIFFVKKLNEWYSVTVIPSKEYFSVRINKFKVFDLLMLPFNNKLSLNNFNMNFAIKDRVGEFSRKIANKVSSFLKSNTIKKGTSENQNSSEFLTLNQKNHNINEIGSLEKIGHLLNNKLEYALFQEIADMVPDMLYVTDIVEMRKIYSNKRIHDLFNLSMEDISLLGSKFFDRIIYPDDKDKYFESIKELKFANDDEVKELRYRIIDANNKIHWIKTKRKIFKRDQFGTPCHILGISQDITEQVKLSEEKRRLEQEKIKLRIKQQREILNAILSSQEEERRRVAETLHHEVGQLLFAAQLKLGKSNPEVENILKIALQKTRNVSYELTPLLLNDFGLEAALKDLLEKKAVAADIIPHFSFGYTSPKNKNDLDIVIYRIVQELLNNTIKYALSNNVKLSVYTENAVLFIHYEDDGQGFALDSLNTTSKGFGLNSIKNRVNLLNGFFEIFSQPLQGVKVLIKIPLD